MEEKIKWKGEIRILVKGERAILANLSTGAYVKVEKAALKYINKAIKYGLSFALDTIRQETEKEKFLNFIQELVRKGFLEKVKYKFFELSPTPIKISKKRYLEVPKIAYYEASQKCNLRCKFCYANPLAYKREATYIGNTQLSIRIFDKMKKLGVVYLVLSGGEPFLREDIFDLISYAKETFKFIGITTNGIILSDIKKAKKLDKNAINYIQVSIESPYENIHDSMRGKGTFKKSLQAVKNLKEVGFSKDQIYITATITKVNIQSLYDYIEFAEKLGVRPSFSLYQPVGRSSESSKKFEPSNKALLKFYFTLLKERGGLPLNFFEKDFELKVFKQLYPKLRPGCGLGLKSLGIKETGDVVPCHLFLSSKEFILGNILDDKIVKNLLDFLFGLPTDVDEIEGCKNCDVRYFCGNGCWAATYWKYGNFRKKNPKCIFYYGYYSPIVWNIGEKNEARKIYESYQEYIESLKEGEDED